MKLHQLTFHNEPLDRRDKSTDFYWIGKLWQKEVVVFLRSIHFKINNCNDILLNGSFFNESQCHAVFLVYCYSIRVIRHKLQHQMSDSDI